MNTETDVVADPVGHISISGVHGRKELDERLAHARGHARGQPPADKGGFAKLMAGALIGAALMYLLHPDRRGRRHLYL